ncbi:hypothetical protein EV421DRAFT_1738584 [Armillaria borealis]|uniref:Uncharacterized protein n=1 Tax=Armillaria borealis TaxID=47425 RepID=A0AA39JAK0_9AGAR|nr:hypothetical protein EV421DRAFT_1738584 [Armillaria borealis]
MARFRVRNLQPAYEEPYSAGHPLQNLLIVSSPPGSPLRTASAVDNIDPPAEETSIESLDKPSSPVSYGKRIHETEVQGCIWIWMNIRTLAHSLLRLQPSGCVFPQVDVSLRCEVTASLKLQWYPEILDIEVKCLVDNFSDRLVYPQWQRSGVPSILVERSSRTGSCFEFSGKALATLSSVADQCWFSFVTRIRLLRWAYRTGSTRESDKEWWVKGVSEGFVKGVCARPFLVFGSTDVDDPPCVVLACTAYPIAVAWESALTGLPAPRYMGKRRTRKVGLIGLGVAM